MKDTMYTLAPAGVEPLDDGTVYAVVLDGKQAYGMTESMLDVWWNNQTPEKKAEVYEADLYSCSDGDGDLMSDIMLRNGMGAILDRINAYSEAFAETYNRPINAKAAR